MNYVWYVAFGSNMAGERLAIYLSRARDSTPPTDSKPFRLGHPVIFAGQTRVWGSGGVAFLDTSESGVTSYGRAWRISLGQFEDVYRQENGLAEVVAIDPARIGIGSSASPADQRYGVVRRFCDTDGEPTLTFTSGQDTPSLAAAGPAYLRIIGEGLTQGWGLTISEIAEYLHGCAPNSSHNTLSEIDKILNTPAELPN